MLKLMHVGEAASGLDESIRDNAPAVPWSDIIGMRNILIHEYDRVDVDIVWEVVQNHLPELRKRVSALYRRFRDSSDQPPADP